MQFLPSVLCGVSYYTLIAFILPKIFRSLNKHYKKQNLVDVDLLSSFSERPEYYENKLKSLTAKVWLFLYIGGFTIFGFAGCILAYLLAKNILMPCNSDGMLVIEDGVYMFVLCMSSFAASVVLYLIVYNGIVPRELDSIMSYRGYKYSGVSPTKGVESNFILVKVLLVIFLIVVPLCVLSFSYYKVGESGVTHVYFMAKKQVYSWSSVESVAKKRNKYGVEFLKLVSMDGGEFELGRADNFLVRSIIKKNRPDLDGKY